MEPPCLTVDAIYLLGRWRTRDSAALRRFDQDPASARYFGWTVEAARALPDSHYDGPTRERQNLEEWQAGDRLSLAIRSAVSGDAVGFVELRPKVPHIEVSYMVAAELRGQGIAPRALTTLLQWATNSLRERRVILECDPENAASRRVAEKCGFDLEHVGPELLTYSKNLPSSAQGGPASS